MPVSWTCSSAVDVSLLAFLAYTDRVEERQNEGEDKNNDKELNKNDEPGSIAMFADMGRGTDDDAATWNEYGSPAFNTSRALAADADAIDAVILFVRLSYASGYQSVWDDYQGDDQLLAPQRVPLPRQPGQPRVRLRSIGVDRARGR